MTLSGLAMPFVVPPVNLAILAGLAVMTGRRRLAGGTLALLLLLAMPLVADALTAALERGQDGGTTQAAQAIVVLGAETVREADGHTSPGPLTLERLRRGAALARRTGLPLLVTGGVTERDAAPVATAMAESLRDDFGLTVRWTEDRATDTFDNASDTARLLAPAQVTTVLLVTHQWHMRRALLAFRTTGLTAIPAPVPPHEKTGLRWGDLIPRVSAWQRSYYALHEWIGLLSYEMRARW